MDELMNYIFGSLRRSEKIITKSLREQKSFNHSVKLFAVIITINTIALKFENSKMSNEIKNLKTEIDNLKNMRENDEPQ